METPVKLFTAWKGFLFWRQPPSPPPAHFDDGLTEIARLIEREAPVEDFDTLPKTSLKDRASQH